MTESPKNVQANAPMSVDAAHATVVDASIPTQRSMLGYLVPLLAFLAIVVSAVLVIQQRKGGEDPNELPSMLVGKAMPAFKLPVLGEENRLVSNSDLQGTPYLLNLWATWCPTCYVEHPYLLQLAQQNRIRLIGLNYKDEREKALQYLTRLGNPYETTLVDADGMLGIELGVYGAPETFLVAGDGTILYRRAGDLNERVWQDDIVPLLEQMGLTQTGAQP